MKKILSIGVLAIFLYILWIIFDYSRYIDKLVGNIYLSECNGIEYCIDVENKKVCISREMHFDNGLYYYLASFSIKEYFRENNIRVSNIEFSAKKKMYYLILKHLKSEGYVVKYFLYSCSISEHNMKAGICKKSIYLINSTN